MLGSNSNKSVPTTAVEPPNENEITRRKAKHNHPIPASSCIPANPLLPNGIMSAFLTTTRRIFCQYVIPTIPVLSSTTLAKLFSNSEEVPEFIKFLRVVSVAATAPYLAPQQHSLIAHRKRDQIIDEYYNMAKTRLENATSLTDLETVQGFLFLSFCARRHVGLSTLEKRHWLQAAISSVSTLQRNKDTLLPYNLRTIQLWRRTWWTCYLYERLDAFDSVVDVQVPHFRLNVENMAPLSLGDFDVDRSFLSWTANNSHGSRIDLVTMDLRMASIHVQKIWLARQIDGVICTALDGSLDFSPSHDESLHATDGLQLVSDSYFWNAYQLELDFSSWQKRTGNTSKLVAWHSGRFPSLAVHWASLYLLYYRIILAFYHAALANSMARTRWSLGEAAHRLLECDRIVYFASRIVERAVPLLDRGQAPYAYATDPNIWTSVLIAAEVLETEVDAYRLGLPNFRQSNSKPTLRSSRELVSAFEQQLVEWGSVPRPVSSVPEPFRFPGSPQCPRLSSVDLNARASSEVSSHLSRVTAPTPAFGIDNWEVMDATEMLEQAESMIYNSGVL